LLVLDADGLIKLHRAEVLELIAQEFECVVPPAVYREVVTRGRERHHPDVDDIERIVNSKMTVWSHPIAAGTDAGMGPGETEVLDLLAELYRRSLRPVVVSDDRAFIAILSRMGQAFFLPAVLIVELARSGTLTQGEAAQSLGRLQPFIRDTQYRQAIRDIERL